MLTIVIDYINIISAVLIIICVLLQNRGSGLSGTFGGDSESYYTRRGMDKVLLITTIILLIVFISSTLLRSIIN
ncbi:MAG: preprotein translocase subunit SecG [Patescibacteria group bacterium]|nr:preprotein translocase subunit SecG [Patescibacteria group bacterium]